MFNYDDYHYGYTARQLYEPVPDNNYGKDFPAGTSQLIKELHGYFKGGIGGLSRFHHMVNAIKLQWPKNGDFYFEFVNTGIINTSALRVIHACCENKDLGVAGSASSGKTFPIAAFINTKWRSAPDRTLAFICTTSIGASEDRIWGAICKLHKEATTVIGNLIEYKKVIVWGGVNEESASDREYSNAIKALAIEQGLEGKKAIDTTRGRKNKIVMLVYDELPEMGLYVNKARVNLASNPDFQAIGIGNPNDKNDAHGDWCQPKAGWETVDITIPEWETRTGRAIFLNGEWTPNNLVDESQPIPFPYLTNRNSLADMLRFCYGDINSLEYWRNAVGFWIGDSIQNTVLSREIIKAYGADEKAKWQGSALTRIGTLDTGFTVGGDLCVGTFFELGPETSGRKVLQPIAEKIYYPKEGEIFEQSIARQFVDDCIKYEVEPPACGLDISNDGGKIAQEIMRYWAKEKENPRAFDIVPISSQGKPTERIVSEIDRRTCEQAYDRRVTEYWFSARQGVLCKVIKGLDVNTDAVRQLCSRKYWKKKEKIEIETKDEMKLRLRRSPDNADSFVYGIEIARRYGLEFITDEAFRMRQEVTRRREMLLKQPTGRGVLTASKVGNYGSNDWGERD